MIWYNIKIALRNIAKRKLYSFVNISGLAIGLASFIIVSLYIIDEVSYDRYHSKSNRIYRVVNVYDFNGVGEESSSCPYPVAPHLAMEYPNYIESVVRFFNDWSSPYFVEYENKGFRESRLFFVDSTVFDVFDIDFITGNPKNALNEPGKAIITESTAKRYFENENPMGKTLRVEQSFDVIVAGVIKDTPLQSHFHFDMLLSMGTIKNFFGNSEPRTWVWNPFWTYIVLKEGVDANDLEDQFPQFVEKYFYDAEKDNISMHLQPLTDIHLKSSLDYEIEANGEITYIRILSIIGFFLLIIASINFMNLATAIAGKRAREIGLKKVVGSYRGQLISQFITESVVLSIIGLLIALALVEIIIPYFNEFTGKSITSNYFLEPVKLSVLLGVALITGLISGIYPAFYLSSFKPVVVLRGDFDRGDKGVRARKILVVLQFTISIALIIATVISFQQIRYLQKKDLGFTHENIIFLPVMQTPIAYQYETFKAEMLKSPGVYSVTATDYIVGTEHNTHEFRPEGFPSDQWQFYPAMVVRDDFIKTFDIEIVAGRGFYNDGKLKASDAVIINESMVRYLNWGSNNEAIGKSFRSNLGREKVVGVFKDFHANSLHAEVTPLVIYMMDQEQAANFFTEYIAVRYYPGKEKEVIAHASKVWYKISHDRPFDYYIHSDKIAELYSEENLVGNLSAILAFLIVFIATLGLYGLASYMVDQRTKEIGIRRVLGAEFIHIVTLLSKEFNWMLIIANVIAWPIAYFLMRYWLQNFAYRVHIQLAVFVFAGIVAFIIAFSISTLKAIGSFRNKPADTLKYE